MLLLILFLHAISCVVQYGTLLIPLDISPSRWWQQYLDLSIAAAIERHQVQVILEDEAALTPGRPYVVGAFIFINCHRVPSRHCSTDSWMSG